ncbi:uncharacterized protein V1510DRAFT_347730, partial [Dipodascopsis tothii]|uniref:uncharacterized protein n=1 Tax=Dipodascopsis tothii TaxID=44089 RepID=UPI0034CDC7AB
PEDGFPVVHAPAADLPLPLAAQLVALRSRGRQVLAVGTADEQLDWASAYCDFAQHSQDLFGHSDHVLLEDAREMVLHMTSQRSARAVYVRARWAEQKRMGLETEAPLAYDWYQWLAKNGFSRALYRIGIIHEIRHEYDAALRAFREGAAAEDAGCLYALGVILLKALDGQAADVPTALDFLRRAAAGADADVPAALYVYGMLLTGGALADWAVPAHMVDVDEAHGRELLERAALYGVAPALVSLGMAWQQGTLGLPFDPAVSLHYYVLAAKRGDADACLEIAKWFLTGCDGIFDADPERAFKYAERAVARGSSQAEFALGYFYEVGIYVSADMDKARQWYTRAAEHDNEDARQRLA